MATTQRTQDVEYATLLEQLQDVIPSELLNDFLEAYGKCKHSYFLGDYRPSCLEAGRFAEVGIRIAQHLIICRYTPLTQQLKQFHELVREIANQPVVDGKDSVRIIIPKVLQIIYDLRNKRNVGHVGGDVDENYADATLAINSCNWVLAELVRIFYTGDINEAQKIVDSLAEVKAPIIQDFNGFPKLLSPKLSVSNKILLLLHHRNKRGAMSSELVTWIGKASQANVMVSLGNLVKKGQVHRDEEGTCFITFSGEKAVADIIKMDGLRDR